MVFLLSLVFIAIIALEAPALVKGKNWRELAAFSVLLLIGMVYSYGQALDIPLPNPTKLIMVIFEPVALYVERLLT
ncbi:MAG: hypothetical protein JL50_18960 [Peptococcaceae bacterium BICA1-7]|nr:MAG: hypothetical protein JL50_18960 [Peptococcaceae bacterium BICA1-7]HBV98981.1 hypothetical protein [Desulfotomaculum sp.]